MNEMIIYNSGLQSTFQDLGRWGHQSMGYSVGGAMDTFALQAANLLTENDPGEACIEMLMMGIEVSFTRNTVIAITGADMRPEINGKPVEMWVSHWLKAGDRLKMNSAVTGMRAYLSVKGGFAIKPYLGSKSTGIQEKTGWRGGSLLLNGYKVGVNGENLLKFKQRRFRKKCIPGYYTSSEKEIRVIGGPFEDHFSAKGLDVFYHTLYRVGNDINRVGYRLEGEPIEQKVEAGQLISLSMATGSIQVPGGGQPIILCVERRTHGGYPVIATVTSTDMARVGQCRTGDVIHFQKISVEEAHRNLKEQELLLRQGKALETRWTRMRDGWE